MFIINESVDYLQDQSINYAQYKMLETSDASVRQEKIHKLVILFRVLYFGQVFYFVILQHYLSLFIILKLSSLKAHIGAVWTFEEFSPRTFYVKS